MDEHGANSVRTRLGKRIRELREQQGFSLRKFALMVDLSYPYLSNIETGKQAATVDSLDKIARGLDVEIRDLF